MAASPLSSPPDTVLVPVEQLAFGHVLGHPVFDGNGVLLLAAGSVVNSSFKRLLRSHQIEQVLLHRDDARQSSERRASADAAGAARLASGQLDSSAPARGEPVQRRMPAHGRKAYDAAQRQKLVQHYGANARLLNRLMEDLLQSGKLALGQLNNLADSYLAEMIADVDNVLTTAADVGQDLLLVEYCLRLSLLGMAIGIELGYDEYSVRHIAMAGLLHDWGMMRVPAAIRNADRPLTDVEWMEVKRHPTYSLELLEGIKAVPPVVSLVCYQVHEKPNGTGFPRGRSSRAIHPFARILHVADAYLAMTSHGIQRSALMPYKAMEHLLRQIQQRAVDATAARGLLHVLSLFPLGSIVGLSDGSTGCVMRRNGPHYMSPIVGVVRNSRGERLRPSENLVDPSAQGLRIDRVMASLPSEDAA